MTGRSAVTTELSAMLRLAWPLVIAQLAAVGQGVIEVVLAGHLDAHVLGAVAIGANLFSVPLMTMIGTMYAVPAFVSQLDGARKRHEVAGLFRQAVLLGLAMGVLMFAAVRWGAPLLVLAVGVPDPLARDVVAFLHAVAFALPSIGVFVACRGLSDGLSLPRASMVMSVAGLFLLLPVGYVLMYGALGFPRLGAAGTGYAAALVDCLQAAVFLAWVRFGRRYSGIGWQGAASGRPDLKIIGGLLRVGLPMGFATLMEVGVFSGSALAIGRFGEVAASSHQVALNVAALVFMVPLGLASAITVRVGGATGRGDLTAARRAGLVGIGLVLVTQSVSSSVILSVPGEIARLYTTDAAVIAGATVLLRIAGISSSPTASRSPPTARCAA